MFLITKMTYTKKIRAGSYAKLIFKGRDFLPLVMFAKLIFKQGLVIFRSNDVIMCSIIAVFSWL